MLPCTLPLPRLNPISSPGANARSHPITTASGPDTFGVLNQLPSSNLSYQIGVSHGQGQRASMEDTYGFVVDFDGVHGQGLFEVFDGHGNKLAAEKCGAEFHQHLLTNIHILPNAPIPDVLDSTFHTMDQCLLELSGPSSQMAASGCTAVTAFLRIEDDNGQQPFVSPSSVCSDNLELSGHSQRATIVPPTSCKRVLYCANAGDARAVLSRGGQAMRLTHDHKATEPTEMARIKSAGGVIYRGRVLGYLNVSRSLGNHDSNDGFSLKQFVIGKPYTSTTKLSDEDEFLILACDGLWDVITDQDAVDLIRHTKNAQEASDILLKHAFSKGTHDNVTVIVVIFKTGL